MIGDTFLELMKAERPVFLNAHNLDETQRSCDRVEILRT